MHAGVQEQPETTWAHLKQNTKTKLPDGRLSLLVDLGSRINIIGKNTAEDFKRCAESNGHEAKLTARQSRLNVNGVGAGSAPCDTQILLPIAVKFEESPATLDNYTANVAEGSGSDLPGILGSKSMQDKDAVLILRDGKEMLVFPGPGGYKIEWSPGTKRLPMISAPSGHLVVPCDKF